jgi:hypothetical protein
MIAKLTLGLIVLTAFAGLVPAASADPFGAGDCSKGGLCVGGCVGLRTECGDNSVACVGVSYQVPQCVGSTAAVAAPDARCIGLPCDVINAVCWVALHTWCVG